MDSLEINSAYITVLVFFIGYALLEIPSNIAIKHVGPAIWLAAIALSWGAVTIGMGFVKSWVPFAGCRAILGSFEAVGPSLSDTYMI